MDLLKAYNAVDKILNTLDFSAVFEGFHKYRFALYNSSQICIDGRLIPYQEGFMGNTSIPYENEFIAIWNVEYDPVEDIEHLAYCLVHEMFHCFQKDNDEDRYPSDLVLLNYPDDVDNYIKKYNENKYLADAYETNDVQKFKKFHELRNQRLSVYSDIVTQELRVETLEGAAEYAGLKALRYIDPEKFRTAVKGYLEKLREESDLIFDVRRISYYSGAVYFLCLDLFEVGEKYNFNSKLTIYEQNAEAFGGITGAEIKPCETVSRNYAGLKEKRSRTVSDHISRSSLIECDAYICGYDPMNMFRIGDVIYCSHFVFLKIDGDVKMIKEAVALKVKTGSTNEITGYYI